MSLTKNYNNWVELLAILTHFLRCSSFKQEFAELKTAPLPNLFSLTRASISNNILIIVFSGVRISWDVEAIMISLNFSTDYSLSLLISAVISRTTISLHLELSKLTAF